MAMAQTESRLVAGHEVPHAMPFNPNAALADAIGSTALILLLSLSATALALRLHGDYRAFLALGPGGTPATLTGFLRVKALSLFALRDPYEPLCRPRKDDDDDDDDNADDIDTPTKVSRARPAPGFLDEVLPMRQGPRPTTAGIAPHRQTSQMASPAATSRLAAALQHLGEEREGLVLGTSCFEPHSTGLLAVAPSISSSGSSIEPGADGKISRRCAAEVAHAHASDGSLHVTLQAHDADAVLAARWGERHPLSRGGWLERFVPRGFVLVYAPRGEEELRVVMRIVRAAAEYVEGSLR